MAQMRHINPKILESSSEGVVEKGINMYPHSLSFLCFWRNYFCHVMTYDYILIENLTEVPVKQDPPKKMSLRRVH